jgi:poly(3-hydroxybutyrate) depolymerase
VGVIGKLGRLTGQFAHFRNRLPLTASVQSFQIDSRQSPLAEVSIRGSNPGGFSNPGALRMFFYSPTPLSDPPALVVVLHG